MAQNIGTATGEDGVYSRLDMFRDGAAGFGQYAHRRFYGDIVRLLDLAKHHATLRAAKVATKEKLDEDHALNNVRNLGWWDAQAYGINSAALSGAFQTRGDYVTQAGLLYIMKEAVRQHHGDTRDTLAPGEVA